MLSSITAEFNGITPKALVMWERPKASGAVISAVFLVWLVFGWMEYTLLAATCRVAQLSIASIGAMIYLGRLDAAALQSDVNARVERALDAAKPQLTKAIEVSLRVASWEQPQLTMKVFGASIAISVLGGLFDVLTLLMLATAIIFSAPLGYEKNKAVIDPQVAKLQEQLAQLLKQIPAVSDMTKKKQ